jgi:hypothetical protein
MHCARVARADADALERICRQRFVLAHGRRMTQIRELLAMRRDLTLNFASDLAPELIARLRDEPRWGGERIHLLERSSRMLRACRFVSDLFELTALHAAAAVRIAQTALLPAALNAPARRYAAWLGAEPAVVARAGPEVLSLPEFLTDALSSGAVDEIVVQGAKPAVALPAGLLHRRSRFALRSRPPLSAILRALVAQAALLLSDIAGASDWRRRQLLAHVTAGAVGTRLWFEHDPPRAVLYPNSVIGAEPAAPLVARDYAVSTMMVFYSANLGHTVNPTVALSPGGLEPEIRYIAAERLGMWSTQMQSAFLAAGYPAARLPVTGVVHYGRQAVFRPSSRFAGAQARGPVRLGVFDVTLNHPARRFLLGFGQTFYCERLRNGFFCDLLAAAERCWPANFVIVRKLKRELQSNVHEADIDLESLAGADRIRSPGPATSLWSVLSEVDLVVCMPFTSVAYIADQYGIPAAYYDPSCTITPSPLAGRCPLLQGRRALEAWFAEPRAGAAFDPKVLVAAETLKAACGDAWREPRLAAGASLAAAY